MTLLDLFNLAAADIGVIGAGETLSANDQAMMLLVVNGMVDSFGAMRSMLFSVARATYSLQTGVYQYTIGPTGTFAQQRPVTIQRAGVVLSASTNPAYEEPIQILDADEYASIGIKGLASTWPTAVYYDYGDVSGNGTLTFNYSPTQGGNQVALYYPQQMSQWAQTQLTQQIYIPPGYQETMEYGLALRAANKFGRSLPPESASLGHAAMASIRARNAYIPQLKTLVGRLGGYNWLTDRISSR